MDQFLRKYSYYIYSIFELLVGMENPLQVFSIFLKRPAAGVKTIRLRQNGLQFKVRGAMDIWSIKETFLDRFYERFGFVVQPGWTVIDIGAGLGDFTIFTARIKGTSVFAFEPFPESYGLLEQNLGLNQVQNAQIFSEAVGGSDGTLVLDLGGGEPLQFQSRSTTITGQESQMAVGARSLSSIINQLKLESCDLLKLDCEGAEYDILLNAPPVVLSKIRRIVMEYHDQITKFTHQDLVEFLREKGFSVEIYANPVHGNIGYLRAAR